MAHIDCRPAIAAGEQAAKQAAEAERAAAEGTSPETPEDVTPLMRDNSVDGPEGAAERGVVPQLPQPRRRMFPESQHPLCNWCPPVGACFDQLMRAFRTSGGGPINMTNSRGGLPNAEDELVLLRS